MIYRDLFYSLLVLRPDAVHQFPVLGFYLLIVGIQGFPVRVVRVYCNVGVTFYLKPEIRVGAP